MAVYIIISIYQGKKMEVGVGESEEKDSNKEQQKKNKQIKLKKTLLKF